MAAALAEQSIAVGISRSHGCIRTAGWTMEAGNHESVMPANANANANANAAPPRRPARTKPFVEKPQPVGMSPRERDRRIEAVKAALTRAQERRLGRR